LGDHETHPQGSRKSTGNSVHAGFEFVAYRFSETEMMPVNAQPIRSQLMTGSTLEIRIIGLNRDLTRETDKVDSRYEVYFDLSGTPSPAWTKILTREWKKLNPTEPRLWDRVTIDKRYLVMHWPPQEIAQKHLPVLKLAVAATNKTHNRNISKLSGAPKRPKK
jgi:hypothetical protein